MMIRLMFVLLYFGAFVVFSSIQAHPFYQFFFIIARLPHAYSRAPSHTFSNNLNRKLYKTTFIPMYLNQQHEQKNEEECAVLLRQKKEKTHRDEYKALNYNLNILYEI